MIADIGKMLSETFTGMKTRLEDAFGVTSSPSLATRVLRHAVIQY